MLVWNQSLQVPQGLIEKPVRVRYDPVTVIGSFQAICHWALKQSKPGKAPESDDLKSGELLVIVISMILTVDRKHSFSCCIFMPVSMIRVFFVSKKSLRKAVWRKEDSTGIETTLGSAKNQRNVGRSGKVTKKQIGKRFLQILVVLFGISFFTFGLTYLSPGDPAEIMLTECGNIPTPELLEKTRAELGLDKPFIVQYGTWLKGVLTGDMGTSYSMKVPVVDKLTSCFWPTLQLALMSLLMMVVISIPLGILSAVYQNKWPDYLVRAITFFGVSIPSFWIGLIFLSIFGVTLRWVAVAGGTTDFKSLILPSLTLAIAMSAKYTRQVRNAVLDELHQDYVTGARMRGCKESTILWKHVLPNAMLPLVTLLGLSLGSLLGGTAVVEIIYNWPGMGSMAVKAISCRDYPLVQGYVLWIAILYMGINLLVDLSYTYLDPRLKGGR